MKNKTDHEKLYINLILQKISEKLQLNEPEEWQQRDFENLSLLIEEKTGISLSVSTLKRISKNQFQKIPQKNTLNALAQFIGYKDWYEFKTTRIEKDDLPVTAKKHKFRFSKKIIYFPVAAIIIFLVSLLILNSQPAQSYSEAKFSSKKNVAEGVPNTVIFDYDISMYDFDSAFVQQSWDTRRRAEIKKNERYSTSVYYYPGYHKAKLMINEQLVKEIPVYITTDGWLNLIQNPMNDIVPIYVKENCINNGQIYISPETVEKHNVNLVNNNHATCFYYVNENFYGDSDNFTFKTRLKNSMDEGALVCQACEISIFGENGRHFVQLSDPGCIGSLYLKFGSDYVSGENNDLSAFGTNLNQWNDLKLVFKNKIVTIYLNNIEIYKTSYTDSNGAIKGVYYQFAGSGAVDYVRLYDAEENPVFSEDFEQSPSI